MSGTTSTAAQPAAAPAPAVKAEAPIVSQFAIGVQATFDTESNGIVGDFARGWSTYDHPAAKAGRKAADARKREEVLAWLLQEMQK